MLARQWVWMEDPVGPLADHPAGAGLLSRSLLSESLDHLLSCPTASVISQVLFSGQVWWHFSVGPSQGVLCDSFYLFFFLKLSKGSRFLFSSQDSFPPR